MDSDAPILTHDSDAASEKDHDEDHAGAAEEGNLEEGEELDDGEYEDAVDNHERILESEDTSSDSESSSKFTLFFKSF